MSGEGIEAVAVKVVTQTKCKTKWESDFWIKLSNTDGYHCPIYYRCKTKKEGAWCPDDHLEALNRLQDAKQFNLKDYEFIKSGTCGGPVKTVERLTKKLLKEAGIHAPPVPISILSLLNIGFPIEIRYIKLKIQHGACWCLRNGSVVQIKDDDPFSVQRFTLFHEVFHVLCRHNCTGIPWQNALTEAPFKELLACYFAGFLLMPTEWLKKKWAYVKDLDRIAKIFDVPKPCMCIRLKRIGLI